MQSRKFVMQLVNAGTNELSHSVIVLGIGNFGSKHVEAIAFRNQCQTDPSKKIHVVGFASRDKRVRAGDLRHLKCNWDDSPGMEFDTTGMRIASDWKDLIAQTTGVAQSAFIFASADMHKEMACTAHAAGMNVFVEKPIAMDVTETKAMAASASKHKKACKVAHVVPFMGPYAKLYETIQAKGGYKAVKSFRCYRKVSRIADEKALLIAKTTGRDPDLLVHEAHLASIFGTVESIQVSASRREFDRIQSSKSEIRIAGSTVPMQIETGAESDQNFECGFYVTFNDGTWIQFKDWILTTDRSVLSLPNQSPAEILMAEHEEFLNPKLGFLNFEHAEAAMRTLAAHATSCRNKMRVKA